MFPISERFIRKAYSKCIMSDGDQNHYIDLTQIIIAFTNRGNIFFVIHLINIQIFKDKHSKLLNISYKIQFTVRSINEQFKK